jgi:hypothetical protein
LMMRRFASTCFIQAGEIQHFPVRITPLEQMITKPFFQCEKAVALQMHLLKKRETADLAVSLMVMQSALRQT